MAIQVSYLEQKLYPPWFQRSGPPTGKGTMPTGVTHESVKSFGEWPRLKRGVVKSPGLPVKVKHEAVKSPGLPATPKPASSDGWLEIGQPYFRVIVDGKDLGFWVKLDGLSMKVEVAEHRTGDGHNYRWIEPTYSSFPNIKLSRAATAKGCNQSLAWLMHAQYAWKKGMTAVIQAKPLWHRTSEAAWFSVGLADVMPAAWTGPNFSTDGKVAMEVLELAYSGFLPPSNTRPYVATPPPYIARKKPTPAAPPPPRDLTAVFKAPPPPGISVAPTR